MAEVADIRDALELIGLSPEAAVEFTDNQGMDTLNEFALLTDKEVTRLFEIARKPGGVKPNPDYVEGGEMPAEIPNPGVNASAKACNNVMAMCFYIRYKNQTSRPVTAADITIDEIRKYRELKVWREKHEEPEMPKIQNKDWPSTFDAIEHWMRGCLGATGIPLAYVIRENVDVPNHGDDPVENYNGNHTDELIARAPHKTLFGGAMVFTAEYKADNILVWEKISELTRDHTSFTYIRSFMRKQDGRGAYMALKKNYLGRSHIDNMANAAEAKLRAITYKGEGRRWNFEKYVSTMIEQFTILNRLKEHGHAGIDDRSMVRHLVAGIQADNLEVAKTAIVASPELRNNFADSVNLFQDLVRAQERRKDSSMTVASMNSRSMKYFKDEEEGGGDSGGSGGATKADMSVKDVYYPTDEYRKLSKAQRYGLKLKREQKRKRGQNGRGAGKGTVQLDKRSIKAVAAMIQQQAADGESTADAGGQDGEDDEPLAKKAKTNRTNKSLMRK